MEWNPKRIPHEIFFWCPDECQKGKQADIPDMQK